MPSRDSANVVATADEAPRDALTVLPLALPLPLATRIWGSLPCDVRLRCREVCPAWRDALAESRAWSEVDLTATSGVVARITPALLRAAVARAGGRLERLFVTYDQELQAVLKAALLAVIAANMDTLRLLRIEHRSPCYYCTDVALATLLRTAPRQCVVEADISVHIMNAGALLCNSPPFEALRLRSLRVGGSSMTVTGVAALAVQLAAHLSLRELVLVLVPLRTCAALDALVDAALALRLTKLVLSSCDVGPASAVALPRLLRGEALGELTLYGDGYGPTVLLDAPAAALLADALRSNRTLTSLTLCGVRLWGDVNAAAALFDALVGHASLTSIGLSRNDARSATAAGALLSALVVADTPQLRVLDVSANLLGDAGLGSVMNALQRNTHLRKLNFSHNGMSYMFVRDRLMPALAANTSLRKLTSDCKEADAFIAARTAAMAAAAHD